MRVYALVFAFSIAVSPALVGAAPSVTSCSGFPLCPMSSITPGAIATRDKNVVCTQSTKTVRYVSASEKQQVYTNYNVDPSTKLRAEKLVKNTGAADVDEVRSSGLNPEMPGKPGPGGARYEVDHLIPLELENRLHKLVCAGTITLPEAQDAIKTDWIKAYRKYVAAGS